MTAPLRLDLRGRPPEPGELETVAERVRSGGLVAYPTETVYGLGGLARGEAVDALRRLKGREERHPFLVLIADPEWAEGLRWTPEARTLADVFWPGALTLVLSDPAGTFPPGVRTGEDTVAVRLTPHPVARALVEAVGEPLTSTSANRPGEPPARSGGEVASLLEGTPWGGDVSVVDAGTLPPSDPSTVVDCTGEAPVVLREGAVPMARLRCAVGGVRVAG